MNNNGFNKTNSDDNNLNKYINNGQNFNNENNFSGQNNIYNNQNQSFDNGINQDVSSIDVNNSGFNNFNNHNNNGQSFNNENNFSGQNNIYNNQNQSFDNGINQDVNSIYVNNNEQNFNNSFLGNDNNGNQDANLSSENNDLQNYSINNSDKKTTSKTLIIIIVLSLSTLFWCFFIFIFVSGINKNVESTQEYLNDARINTFIDNAKSSISNVYTDVLVNGYKPYYSLNEINSLLDNKLTLSPFGSKYKDSSCIKVINNNEVSYGYDFQMCLIDEDGNGFTLTDQYDLSNNSFKLKSLKNIECSCS